MKKFRELALTLVEVGRVLRILPRIEWARRRQGPRALLEHLRRQGRRARERDGLGRERLCRAIRWVDACMIGGGNCFRRALLEMALDRGAAGDPLLMGFNVHGGRLAGHAWLPADDTGERRGVGSPVPPAYQFTVRL